MQRSRDTGSPAGRPALHGLTTGALVFCCVFAFVLVEFAISHRSVAEAISEAVRVEFAGAIDTPATASPEIVQIPNAMQTARRN